VGQLARAFNHMASEVKRVREMQRQFVANVSHDLRSPLTSIIGFSQALTDDATITPQQRRAAEIINHEAERLYRLTRDLLDLSRLEAGRLPLSRRPLDLNDVLRDVATRYHAQPDGRGTRFVEELCGDPLPVLGDPDRLAQVVGNLLDNALKFCTPGGEVRLRSARQGGIGVVEVYNSGAGIPPGELPRVFDRFYRGDHSRAQQTGGSGIGLAIVRELVHAHGGEVTPSSEVGVGTTMTVRLPLAPDAPFTKDLQAANTGVTSLPL
jgi:signal transduction histidine kinase